jgi:hypothetical protein
MNEAHLDLTQRRGEIAAIYEAMARVSRAFEMKVRDLERAGNKLLSTYREANRKARTGPTPAYFARPWAIPRLDYSEMHTPRYSEAELTRIINETKSELDAQVAKLNDLHERAMVQFRSLDSLDS